LKKVSPSERYQFLIDQLAPIRPLDTAIGAVILDYVRETAFDHPQYSGTPAYIAWLAAGDATLGPDVVAIYVDRALHGDRQFARSLSFFGPSQLAHYELQLLALYSGGTFSGEFLSDLNFGIGNAGPAAVEQLISELNAYSVSGRRAPSAASALCRAGNASAIDHLNAKLQAIQPRTNAYPMSYAYALARLGRGAEAQQAAAIKYATPLERACLDEIVTKFPNGGAPDSICLLQGPSGQTANAYQPHDQASLQCLAPRTPAPD
jgi:hypothetical protein